MSTEASIITYYAARANEYERIYEKPERQSDLHTLRRFVENAFAGANALEVACGTGYWTEILARTASSVLATDFNEEVLAIARSKNLGPKVVFQHADAYDLPAPERPFNAGGAMFWWSHVPKSRLQAFLTGFHKVLSPGARVVFIDNAFVEGSNTPISRTDEDGNTYQIRRLENGRTYEVLKNFPTKMELTDSLESIALSVHIEFLQYYWILHYLTQK